jgi:hypothetical protein
MADLLSAIIIIVAAISFGAILEWFITAIRHRRDEYHDSR